VKNKIESKLAPRHLTRQRQENGETLAMSGVLVVGTNPPPYGGQTIMMQYLLESKFTGVEMHHVRMEFSDDMDEVGKFMIKKMLELFRVIRRILLARCRHAPTALYYPPAGPNLVPMFRDICILLATRWTFKSVIFHFHSAGISEIYESLHPIFKLLFRMAYRKPLIAIRISELNPDDGAFLAATYNRVIPNGIPDVTCGWARHRISNPATILFVGVLRESKGVLVLLEACGRLKSVGKKFRVVFVGKFVSPDMEERTRTLVYALGLSDQVTFTGVLTGDRKWDVYRKSDIFCFPSFFESESFGIVLLEAMQFGMPVVASRWRGIPSIVEDGKTGLLVKARDPDALAEALCELLSARERAQAMGQEGRRVFEERYTIERFRERMGEVFQLATSTAR
jgi:glycosyltransferase involved in cell wall biosynthesis